MRVQRPFEVGDAADAIGGSSAASQRIGDQRGLLAADLALAQRFGNADPAPDHAVAAHAVQRDPAPQPVRIEMS